MERRALQAQSSKNKPIFSREIDKVWCIYHTLTIVKITLNVDDTLLNTAMEYFDVSSKTKAIDLSLREIARKRKLMEIGRKGLGMSSEEIKNIFDEDYDILSLRAAEARVPYKATRRR